MFCLLLGFPLVFFAFLFDDVGTDPVSRPACNSFVTFDLFEIKTGKLIIGKF